MPESLRRNGESEKWSESLFLGVISCRHRPHRRANGPPNAQARFATDVSDNNETEVRHDRYGVEKRSVRVQRHAKLQLATQRCRT